MAIKNDQIDSIKILLKNNLDIKNGTPGNEQTLLEYAKVLGKKMCHLLLLLRKFRFFIQKKSDSTWDKRIMLFEELVVFYVT